MSSRLLAALLAAFVTLTASVALGQVSLQTQTSGRRFEVGQTFQLEVQAMGNGQDTPSDPTLPVPPGFQVDNIVTAKIALPEVRYRAGERNILFFRRLLESLSSLPGVRYAGYVNGLPLTDPGSSAPVFKEGDDQVAFSARPVSWSLHVSKDYFGAMGIPLKAGRPFKEDEKELVAIVSENAARRIWPSWWPIRG